MAGCRSRRRPISVPHRRFAKLLTKAQRRQEDEADILKILASPDADEESRLEWMRTRQYPPMDDDLSYPTEMPCYRSDVRARPPPPVVAQPSDVHTPRPRH